MATVSNYALRLPKSMMEKLKKRVPEEGTSMNQFIVLAVSEKLTALETSEYLEQKRARAKDAALRILAKAGTAGPVREGDEIPEGWFDERD